MSETRMYDLGGIIMRDFCGINNGVNFAAWLILMLRKR
jgi:hypothetical protein